MALTVFAALTAPLPSQLDASFAAIGAMEVTACIASGTNSITLTPLANQPAIGAYANYMQFSFVARGMSTATVSIQVGSLPQLNLYLADGVTQAGNGHLVGAVIYIIVYNSALGATGGFQIVSQMPVSNLLDIIGTAQGSILYRSATAWTALPPGAKGAQLKTGGASGNPFWVLPQSQRSRAISFTSGGAFSFSSPSGLGASTVVKLTLIGGGGGGSCPSVNGIGGGGGGGGAVAIAYVSGLNANTIYSGAVGTGGNGGVDNASSGGGVTTVSFGGVQFTAAGGQGGRGGAFKGGSGGGATNVLISITGAAGWPGSPAASTGGAGAGGPFGGAGPWTSGKTGIAATAPGSGGSGGSFKGDTGGVGFPGLFLMEWIG